MPRHVLVAVTLAVLAGCDATLGPLPGATADLDLLQREAGWGFFEVVVDGERTTARAEERERFRVSFSPDGTISGAIPPNGFGGRYQAFADGTLLIGPVDVTVVDNDDRRDKRLADAFFAGVLFGERFETDGRFLQIYAPHGTARLVALDP